MHEDLTYNDVSSERSRTERATLDWRRAHEALSRLAKERARLDWQEGGLLVDALRSGAHLHLGFGSFAEYVERMFGYTPHWTQERLRVAEALEGLPQLGQALRDGGLSWSAVRELTRVANADNEHAWLESARGRTLRQIEELVAGHKAGDRPGDPREPSLKRHVLRFDVSAETYATFREAMAKLRREAGSPLDEDSALLLLARKILGGPSDEGRANYQLALTVCESCGSGWQQGRGELVEVGSEIVEMARCDAQHLGSVAQHQNDCRPSDSATVANAGERDVISHVGASPRRARQDIAPAVRRQVMRRDRGRCVVPGCRHGQFLDVHHVVPRSEGGGREPDNLVVLCGAHHRALHRGHLIVEGHVSTGLRFRHADGTTYGNVVDPHELALQEQSFRALRSLGFREAEARGALERVRKDALRGSATIENILRQALALLATDRQARVTAPTARP